MWSGVHKSVRTDHIVELNSAGKVSWQWSYLDAFKPGSCGVVPCESLPWQHGEEKDHFDWTHTNTVSVIPENRWYDSGDKRFRPGNLMVVPRNWSTVLVIDKVSRKVVWHYRGDYKGGLCGGHEAHMIEKGYPVLETS